MSLLDQQPSEQDSVDVEVLFKEARQRRHRRWLLSGTIAVALALVAAGLGFATTRGGSGSSHPRTGGLQTGSDTPVSTPQPKTGPVASTGYTAASAVGSSASVTWAANGVGIYLTDNGGTSWEPITPPMLDDVDAGYRIGSMVSSGTQNLWLPVEDVPGLSQDEPGLIPPGSASVRGSGIERSTDGGKTWQFTALPGCVQECGANISLSFASGEVGFASIGPVQKGVAELFATHDGGAAWTRVGNVPGSRGSRVVFTSARDGWTMNAATFGGDGEEGALFRTTDGGLSWRRASGLPTTDLYEPPTFFGNHDGVVLGRPAGGAPTHRPVVFTTDDGGTTWMAHSTPPDGATAAWTPDEAAIPFSAASPTRWVLFVGPRLYATTDSGRTWTGSTPEPTWGAGDVLSMEFASPLDGWIVAPKPGCPERYPETEQEQEECYPVLMASTDGGGLWAPSNP